LVFIQWLVREIAMQIDINISKKQLHELIDQFIDEQENLIELEKLIRKLLRNYQEWVDIDDIERLLKPFIKRQ
jgi:hypothetical protein